VSHDGKAWQATRRCCRRAAYIRLNLHTGEAIELVCIWHPGLR
jgi:hypothetical protein